MNRLHALWRSLHHSVVFLTAIGVFAGIHAALRLGMSRHPWAPEWACVPPGSAAVPGPLIWEFIDNPKGKVVGQPWAFFSSSVGRGFSCQVVEEVGGVNLALQGATFEVQAEILRTLERRHPEYNIIAELNPGWVVRGHTANYFILLMETLGVPPSAETCVKREDLSSRSGRELTDWLPDRVSWCVRRQLKPAFFLEEARQKLQLHYVRFSLTEWAKNGWASAMAEPFWTKEHREFLFPKPEKVADPKSMANPEIEGLYDFTHWGKTPGFEHFEIFLKLLKKHRGKVIAWVPSFNSGFFPFLKDGVKLRELENRVRRMAEDAGIEVLPPLVLPPGEYIDDLHMTKEGGRKLANAIIDRIRGGSEPR